MQSDAPQQDFPLDHFLQDSNDLNDVIKNCFLIFEGISQYNTPYRVLVVKKKYAFDPALITLFKRIGVTVMHNPRPQNTVYEEGG